MFTKKLILASLLAFLGFTSASANVIQSSLPTSGGWGPLSVPETTAYGLVFAAPDATNTQLNSFSFFVLGDLVKAYAVVAAWNGTHPTNSLFTSSQFPASYNNFTEVTIDTGGIELVYGQSYVAYFATDIVGNTGLDFMAIGSGIPPTGSGAGFVLANSNGTDPLTFTNWNNVSAFFGHSMDIAYILDFSAPSSSGVVPEPGTFALLGLGIAGLGLSRRRGSK